MINQFNIILLLLLKLYYFLPDLSAVLLHDAVCSQMSTNKPLRHSENICWTLFTNSVPFEGNWLSRFLFRAFSVKGPEFRCVP